MSYSQSQTQSEGQSRYNYKREFLYLSKFNRKSAEVYYLNKPPEMSDKEWACHKDNPNRLSEGEQEALSIIDEINHRSAKWTYFGQKWFARRLSVSPKTLYLWLRKLELLGLIEKKKVFHYRVVNGYRVPKEASKYKCDADQILEACRLFDHSECERPTISYTCTSCHRFQGGLSVEQQHNKQIDTIKSICAQEINKKDQEIDNRDQKIAELERELVKAQTYKQTKAKARDEKRQSKAKTRENFLGKLKEEEKAIIYSYEAITGRRFDVEKDLRAFNQINKTSPITAIIGILQTAINLLAKEQEEGKELKAVDINQAVKKATIYSLQYCVGQVEKVGKEFSAAFKQIGAVIQPSKTIMGYLGTVIARLDAKTALEMVGILKMLPINTLGGKAGLKELLGIFASKTVARQIKAGLLEAEDRAEVFKEYLSSLLIEFSLRC